MCSCFAKWPDLKKVCISGSKSLALLEVDTIRRHKHTFVLRQNKNVYEIYLKLEVHTMTLFTEKQVWVHKRDRAWHLMSTRPCKNTFSLCKEQACVCSLMLWISFLSEVSFSPVNVTFKLNYKNYMLTSLNRSRVMIRGEKWNLEAQETNWLKLL